MGQGIITSVKEPEQCSEIVKQVLADLPEWFGLPESTASYIEEAATIPLWQARVDGELAGFIDLNCTAVRSAEVSCMGVMKKFHRQGFGTALMHVLENEAKQHYDFLQVKTVDEGHYPEYDQTIKFYERMGFERLEVFPTLWDLWNPCLILIKKL
ncbi:GNAT family N-acetyltransferase [Lacticaseibacillus jixianensis]|uniref:GNAT family N-acetyltransferase n=1 Tax=Lacticaseibacillus jixianensis TaxID=2486012 RepID=A0ABW4B8C1_9LACO|nr:GNAT family N-acetyltransferase [Lacticaseibacillus jixianensis]